MGTFSQKVKLTAKLLPKLAPAIAGDQPRQKLFLDTQQRGFGISVSAGGTQSYLVLRRVSGRSVRYVFRKVGEGSLADARKRAAELLVQMSDGHDLVAEKRAKAAEAQREVAKGVTLRDALKLALGSLKAKRRSQVTAAGYSELLERYLAAWMDRPLASLTRTDVRKAHQHLAERVARGEFSNGRPRLKGSGRSTANATFRIFRLAWNRAMKEHEELPPNPCVAIDWFAEEKRRAPIGTAGLPALWARINAIENPVRRDWWRVALFTGLRRRSAQTIRTEEVDLEARVLHVKNTKGNRPFSIPLSDYLVDVLKERTAENAKVAAGSRRAKPWLFPALDSKSGHIEEPRSDALGIAPHDARRLFATVCEATDASPYSIRLLLNHALPKADVTGRYMEIELERLRLVMQQVTDRMLALCGVPPAASVTPISAAKKQRRKA